MEDETVSPFGEDTCRLCGLGDAVLPICGRRADGDNLRRNIGKFLAITVCENDALPKMVCLVCFSHLKKMEEFAAMAARTQTKLLECVRSSGSGGGEAEAEAGGGDRSGDHRLQPPPAEGLEDRLAIQDKEQVAEGCQASEKANVALIASADDVQGSLLHSILTKGQSGQGGGGSGEVVESGSVTELEVRVDPMLFLCDQEDTEEPPVSANNNNNNNSNNNNNNHSNEDSPPSPRTSTSDESTATISDPERDMPRLGVENKLWQCGLCPKSFSSENFLHFHMWEHMPFARKMVVPLEQNGSPTHGNMYRHKLYHSSSQCLCQVCGRVYPTRSTLRAHQITHSNLRPHKCSLCDKTFKRNQDLKFHINQHTGERPYRCPYCPKAFASSGNCFSHRKRMHPKQLARDKNKLLSTRH